MTTVRDLLIEGKSIIEKTGVNRDGAYVSADGSCFCALGALYAAAGCGTAKGDDDHAYLSFPEDFDYGTFSHAEDVMYEAVKQIPSGSDLWGVTTFNDHSQTDEEVLNLFDVALTIIDNKN